MVRTADHASEALFTYLVCTAVRPRSQFGLGPCDQTKVPFPRTRQLPIVAAMSAWRGIPPLRPLAVALALWGSCGARADPLDDTFALTIGAFILSTNTTVRADGSAGAGLPVEVGTPIDVERQLGIGDRTSFRLDGYWRFFERHKIRVMYFDESRSAQKSLTDETVFRGQTYPVNTQVSTRLDTGVVELAYEYAFLRGEHYELAGSVGIHDLSFKLQLTAVAVRRQSAGLHRLGLRHAVEELRLLGPAGTSSGPTSTSTTARTTATSPGDTEASGCSAERLTEGPSMVTLWLTFPAASDKGRRPGLWAHSPGPTA